MKKYIFWSKTDSEGIRMHEIKAESCKKAYELLKESGYLAEEITMTGYKGV
jgi:hypothetical protein